MWKYQRVNKKQKVQKYVKCVKNVYIKNVKAFEALICIKTIAFQTYGLHYFLSRFAIVTHIYILL